MKREDAPTSLSRRALIGHAIKAAAGVSLLKSTEILAEPPAPEPAAPPAYNPRQQAAFDIREKAARHGVMHPASFTPSKESEAKHLRITEFSKALRRAVSSDTEPDAGLPELDAFKALKKALNEAYSRTFDAGEQGPNPPDFDHFEALAAYIDDGKPENNNLHLKLTNPLGGLSFDLEGVDPALSRMPPPPSFGDSQTAAEMAELYWMACLRDEPFSHLSPGKFSAKVQQAIDDLKTYSWYAKIGGFEPSRFLRARLPKKNLGFAGVDQGPYLSQFLVRGTADPGKGQDFTISGDIMQGIVHFGSLKLIQQHRTVVRSLDYLRDPRAAAPATGSVEEWHTIQNGSRANIGKDAFAPPPNPTAQPPYYFLRTLRDGANYVHFDEIYQEYLVAAVIILSEIPRPGNNLTAMAASPNNPLPTNPVPAIPSSESGPIKPNLLNFGNPYRDAKAQTGFATFGITYILAALAEVSDRAHKAGWYHKWMYQRIRPEEYAARIDYQAVGTDAAHQHPSANYPLPEEILQSAAAKIPPDPAAPHFSLFDAVKTLNAQAPTAPLSYLLAQAFPEGCPTHPAYPSGHATVAGAAVTILKAVFDETYAITNFTDQESKVSGPPVYEPKDDGTALVQSADQPTLRLGGELNKLASNVVYFRGFAGVHWTSDSIEGILLGERVALELLVEQTESSNHKMPFFRELRTKPVESTDGSKDRHPFCRLSTFEGKAIDIADGKILEVLNEKNSEHPSIDPDNQSTWVRTGKEWDYLAYVTEHYRLE